MIKEGEDNNDNYYLNENATARHASNSVVIAEEVAERQRQLRTSHEAHEYRDMQRKVYTRPWNSMIIRL